MQIAKGAGSSTMSFTMAHKMGLVSVDLKAHDAYDNISYDGDAYNTTTKTWTVKSSGTRSSWNGSQAFTSTYKPHTNSTTCYQAVNPTCNDLKYSTTTVVSTKKYAWKLDCTSIPSENNYESYEVEYNLDYIAASWEFNYTNTVKEFPIKHEGNFQLEVYGAQGGVGTGHTAGLGGKGGYSKGTYNSQGNETLYVCVGEEPDKNGSVRGYNGGGANNTITIKWAGPGGGATHIATATGLLSSLSSNKGAVLIVAGGGGGASDASDPGGSGGGLNGSDGQGYTKGIGGSQTGGGAFYGTATFGQGADSPYFTDASSTWFAGGGGGGWYGGGAGRWCYNTQGHAGSGGGGSGYIGGVENGTTTSGVRTGHGLALISFVPD